MAKRKHHSPEQVILKLEEADRRLNAGQRIEQVCQAAAQRGLFVAEFRNGTEMAHDAGKWS